MERHFFKRMNAQKLQSSVQSSRQFQFFVEDGHYEVNAHRDPYLGLHRIGTRPVVMFDTQMAFDPAEEQFDAPAQPVKLGHGQRRDAQVVGEKDQVAPGFLVVVAHLAQERREVRPGFGQGGFADLVAANSRREIHRQGALSGEAQIVLGSCHEERPGPRDPIHALEIHVAAIHHVECTGLEKQIVEPAHVVLAGDRDEDAGWDWPPQIDLRVHLDPGFGCSEIRPWKECQGEIDGRGVQSVNRVLDIEPEVLPGVERTGFAHEGLGQILPEPPVALFVGIGQSRFGQRLPEAQMVAGMRPRIEAIDNIPQSFPPRELGKRHADELLATTEMPHAGLGIVALHQAVERLSVDQIEKLGQYKSAGIHARKLGPISNASHPF